MAIFELEIADPDVQRVFDAVCANYHRSETIKNPDFNPDLPEDENTNPSMIANPEDQGQFVHRMVRNFLAEHVAAHEISTAKEQAAANTNTEVSISDPQG